MQAYIQQELDRKNRYIYFKNGRWVIHLIIWLGIYTADIMTRSMNIFDPENILYIFLYNAGLFALSYYMYCRYLIPVFFKHNRQLVFWSILIAAVIILPFLNLLIHSLIDPHIPLVYRYYTGLSFSGYSSELASILTAFIALSFLLFLIEIAEGIKTRRSINTEENQLLITEHRLLRTRINPDFMMRSLDGIATLAANDNSSAPDAVVDFSDVLRYRLYHKDTLVSLTEELEQLKNLFHFHKLILSDQQNCELAIAGSPNEKNINPLILVNIAETCFNTYNGQPDWSLVYYLNIETNDIILTIEIHTTHSGAEKILSDVEIGLKEILNMDCNFSMIHEKTTFQIDICIPIRTK